MPPRHLTAPHPEEQKGFSNTTNRSSNTSPSWATVLPDLLAPPDVPRRLPWVRCGHLHAHPHRIVPRTLAAGAHAGSLLPATQGPMCPAQLLLAFKKMWKLKLGQGTWCLQLLGTLVAAEELPVTRGCRPWEGFSPLPQRKQNGSTLTPPWWKTNRDPRFGVIN